MAKGNSVLFRVCCDECSRKSGVYLSERCDRNLRPERRKLCSRCRHSLGFRQAFGGMKTDVGKYRV